MSQKITKFAGNNSPFSIINSPLSIIHYPFTMNRLHLSLFILSLFILHPSLTKANISLPEGRAGGGSYSFRFTSDRHLKLPDAIQVAPSLRYAADTEYGLDLIPPPSSFDTPAPWFFSIRVPDGNYRVTVVLGSRKRAAHTTVRAESRRLFVHNLATPKGQYREVSFIVNKHSPQLPDGKRVNIKKREETKLNWDDKLTIEINGDAPACAAIHIQPAPEVPTVFLCGNSTVVDQDYEPWASWGQMIPRWFNDHIAFANFAESGETASTFIQAGRLQKALSMMKPGDYLIAEFGHNDQKQRSPGSGAYYNFATALKTFVDETRLRQATIIFATPTQRRTFSNQRIADSHADYPQAMLWVAQRENVPVIDLHSMTRLLYEAMGEEQSKRAFVHYPAGTYPGQTADFKDNTHFNPYGAYEIAKCVIQGMKQINLPILSALRPDYTDFNPSHPDNPDTFHWNDSPFFEAEKPDGN